MLRGCRQSVCRGRRRGLFLCGRGRRRGWRRGRHCVGGFVAVGLEVEADLRRYLFQREEFRRGRVEHCLCCPAVTRRDRPPLVVGGVEVCEEHAAVVPFPVRHCVSSCRRAPRVRILSYYRPFRRLPRIFSFFLKFHPSQTKTYMEEKKREVLRRLLSRRKRLLTDEAGECAMRGRRGDSSPSFFCPPPPSVPSPNQANPRNTGT